MKKNKIILIFTILLIISYIIISIVLVIPKGKTYKKTVFIGSNTKVEVDKNNIKVYNDNSKIKGQKVKTYFKNKYIDAYLSSEDGYTKGVSYSIYNNEGNLLIPDSTLIAYTPDLTISINNSSNYESMDLEKLYKCLESNNITVPENIELDYQYIDKLDIDKKNIYIYSVGFIETMSDEDNVKYKSIVFVKVDDKYIIIDSVEGDYNSDYQRLYFYKSIDFNEDNNFEYVIEKLMTEYGPDYYELYDFDGNKFTKIGGE